MSHVGDNEGRGEKSSKLQKMCPLYASYKQLLNYTTVKTKKNDGILTNRNVLNLLELDTLFYAYLVNCLYFITYLSVSAVYIAHVISNL